MLNSHQAGLNRVLELVMRALDSGQIPTIGIQLFDDLLAVHVGIIFSWWVLATPEPCFLKTIATHAVFTGATALKVTNLLESNRTHQCDTPSRLSTFTSVSHKMRMSNPSDWRCKYSTSSFTLSGIGSSSRPFTCAQPVSPGTSACTPCWVRSSIKSCWLNSAGRGPTKLMSPTRMLHNCGNSSRLLLRKKLPMGVKYASWLLSKCVATAGEVLRPTRSDQYRAGPFEVRRTAKATNTIGNNKTSPAHAPAIRSNRLFMNGQRGRAQLNGSLRDEHGRRLWALVPLK